MSEIHEAFLSRLRIGIISHLISQSMSFVELKRETNSTDGNLGVQLSKLEGWGYITSKKSRINGKKSTEYFLTDIGKKEFKEYVQYLGSFID